MTHDAWQQPERRRLNPWAGATITKLSIVRSGSPICFYSARFPLLWMTLADCTLRRTRNGRLWCSPPKRRRAMPDGTTQYTDIVVWDDGLVASLFSEASLQAIAKHSPHLLTPLLEGRDESGGRLLTVERAR